MQQKNNDELLQKAIKAGVDRNYNLALKLLLELLSQSDDYPEAFLYLGRTYHSLKQPEKAITAFRLFLQKKPESAEGFFFLARTYLSENQYVKASFFLERSLKIYPQDDQVLGLLGYAYLKRRRISASLKVLEKAIELAPENKRVFQCYLNALYVSAVKHFTHGNPDMARQILTFVISNGFDSIYTRAYRAHAFRDLGYFEDAIRDYNFILEENPHDLAIVWQKTVCLMALGDHEHALLEIERLRNAGMQIPDFNWTIDSAGRYAAWTAFQEGNYRLAASEALAIIKKDPTDAALHAIVAESCRNIGQLEKSKNHWQKAITLDKSNPDFHYGLCPILYELKDYIHLQTELKTLKRLSFDESVILYYATLIDAETEKGNPEQLIPALQELIRTFGPDIPLMLQLANQYLKYGRADLAETWYLKISHIEPNHELARISLIAVYESLEQEENLCKAYEYYLETYPDNNIIRTEYIHLLFKRHEYTKVVFYLEKALVYEGPLPKNLRALAIAYKNSEKYYEAAMLYRDFIKKDTENPEYVRGLAYCLDKLGNTDIAITILDKAIKFIKNDSSIYMVLGILCAKKNRIEKAIDSFRKATDISPDDYKPYKNIALMYQKQGFPTIARPYFDQAIKLEKKTMHDESIPTQK